MLRIVVPNPQQHIYTPVCLGWWRYIIETANRCHTSLLSKLLRKSVAPTGLNENSIRLTLARKCATLVRSHCTPAEHARSRTEVGVRHAAPDFMRYEAVACTQSCCTLVDCVNGDSSQHSQFDGADGMSQARQVRKVCFAEDVVAAKDHDNVEGGFRSSSDGQ